MLLDEAPAPTCRQACHLIQGKSPCYTRDCVLGRGGGCARAASQLQREEQKLWWARDSLRGGHVMVQRQTMICRRAEGARQPVMLLDEAPAPIHRRSCHLIQVELPCYTRVVTVSLDGAVSECARSKPAPAGRTKALVGLCGGHVTVQCQTTVCRTAAADHHRIMQRMQAFSAGARVEARASSDVRQCD